MVIVALLQEGVISSLRNQIDKTIVIPYKVLIETKTNVSMCEGVYLGKARLVVQYSKDTMWPGRDKL